MFFNNYEVSQVKQSKYAPAYNQLEKEYGTYAQMKYQKSEELISVLKTNNQQRINQTQSELNSIDQQSQAVRKQGIELMKQNNAAANTDDTNYIFLSFVKQNLPIGLIGLLIAIVFLASMGSTASALNSLASTTVVDIYKRLINPSASEGNYLLASRLATVFWGLVCIGMALFAGKVGNLLEAVNLLGSYIYGTILGVFVVAFYFKKIRATPVFVAAIVTELIVCFLGFTKSIAYLWLNPIGCFLVIGIALVVNNFLPAASLSAKEGA
jgi:Na+/proline symporter